MLDRYNAVHYNSRSHTSREVREVARPLRPFVALRRHLSFVVREMHSSARTTMEFGPVMDVLCDGVIYFLSTYNIYIS